MLLTEMDLTAVYCDIAETEKLICETCGKAYHDQTWLGAASPEMSPRRAGSP